MASGGRIVTPQQFCQQSLQVLALPCPREEVRGRAPFETLLGFLATDDLPPDRFEVQLLLLAESEICPCFSAAAVRVLELWRAQQAASTPRALAQRRN